MAGLISVVYIAVYPLSSFLFPLPFFLIYPFFFFSFSTRLLFSFPLDASNILDGHGLAQLVST